MEKSEFQNYLKIQNKLLRFAVSLLFNLSINSNVLGKMIEKGVLVPLINLLKRKDPELLLCCLRFIRQISSSKVHWGLVLFDEIIPNVVKFVFRWIPNPKEPEKSKLIQFLTEGLELLFTLAIHPETAPQFLKPEVFDAIEKFSFHFHFEKV